MVEVASSSISIGSLGQMEWMKKLGKSNWIIQMEESSGQMKSNKCKRG